MVINCTNWCWCPSFMHCQWLTDFNYCSKLAWNILHTWSWIVPRYLKTACNKWRVWGNLAEVLCISIWLVLWIQSYVLDLHKQIRHIEHWSFGSILLLDSNTLCQAGNVSYYEFSVADNLIMFRLSLFSHCFVNWYYAFFPLFHTMSIVKMLQSC